MNPGASMGARSARGGANELMVEGAWVAKRSATACTALMTSRCGLRLKPATTPCRPGIEDDGFCRADT